MSRVPFAVVRDDNCQIPFSRCSATYHSRAMQLPPSLTGKPFAGNGTGARYSHPTQHISANPTERHYLSAGLPSGWPVTTFLPVRSLYSTTMTAMTISRWISAPPNPVMNPNSQRTTRIMATVQNRSTPDLFELDMAACAGQDYI